MISYGCRRNCKGILKNDESGYKADSFALELNNDNGEILAVEYMDQKHVKFADSL